VISQTAAAVLRATGRRLASDEILHRAFAFQRVSVFCALSQQTLSLRAQAGKPNNVDSATECLRFGAQDNILRDALLSSVDFYIRSSSDDWRGNHANNGSLCFQTQGLLCCSQSLARIFCSV
jgi:hypothetical protein